MIFSTGPGRGPCEGVALQTMTPEAAARDMTCADATVPDSG
jgi:hypothetical protein